MRTEAVTTIRQAADDPRAVEGIAVPYGQVATATDIGAEAFAPEAFRASVDKWMSRADGARMAFRPAHGERPIGTVTRLADTPDGVMFRAQLFSSPEADRYLAEASAGLNGVSIEFTPVGTSRRNREGVTVHRTASLHAIAGSVLPAYDGARISVRDMEEDGMSEVQPAERDATPAITDLPAAEREAVELRDAASIRPSSITITREAFVYGRNAQPLADGNRPSFIVDAYNAQLRGDTAAMERQARHYALLTDIVTQAERASDVLASEIPGMYPTDFVPGLLTSRIMKRRPMADYFNRIAIADARPRTFAKVTTSSTVATAADGVALSGTDIATTAVTTTPAIYGGYTDVSRAAFDGGDPSTLSMVFQDLVEAYSQASEAAVKTAVEAGATASGVAITAATPFAGTLANIVNYYATRFKAAGAAFIPSALFSVLLAEGDTTGRPKMPLLNPMNTDGTASAGGASGQVLDATTFLSWSSTANVCVFARPEDYVLFESPIARFTFEQAPGGPHAIRAGVWAYLGIGTRLGGLKVTAA